MKIIPIEFIKAAHTGKWFSPSNVRAFSSKFAREAYLNPEKKVAYFVSSEKQPPTGDFHYRRLYSIRKCYMKTGEISTVGKFQGYGTMREATVVAKVAAGDAKPVPLKRPPMPSGKWVTATKAAKWPEGIMVIVCRPDRDPADYDYIGLYPYFRPDWVGKEGEYEAYPEGSRVLFMKVNL